jgi:predicted amidohydrolase
MTTNGNLKRRVRARAAKTGESYTTALRNVRRTSFRLAVAQTPVTGDPGDVDAIRASSQEIRHLMRAAHQAGAGLVHFPEGAICFPNKRLLTVDGTVGPADWSRLRWDVVRAEVRAIAALAGTLRLWTVLGTLHQLPTPQRPHNSLLVVDDHGQVVARYDERYLSRTKAAYLYTPGTEPVMFTTGGVRFGCALGLEVQFPEVFTEYERADVDCVLYSTTGPGSLALPARAMAASNSYYVSYAVAAQESTHHPAAIVGHTGETLAQCTSDGRPGLALTDLDIGAPSPARDWRRAARSAVTGGSPSPDRMPGP